MNNFMSLIIHKDLEPFVRSWAREVQLCASEMTIEANESQLPHIAEALRQSLVEQPIWFVFAPWFVDGVITASPDAVIEIMLAGANRMHMTSALSLISGGGFTFDFSDGADGSPVVSVAGWGKAMEVVKSIAGQVEGATLFDSRIENRS